MDITNIGSLHAQLPNVHTLSVQFLSVLSYTVSRILVLGVQLSVRTSFCPKFRNQPKDTVLTVIHKESTLAESLDRIGNDIGFNTPQQYFRIQIDALLLSNKLSLPPSVIIIVFEIHRSVTDCNSSRLFRIQQGIISNGLYE